jgi:hypothetical protein
MKKFLPATFIVVLACVNVVNAQCPGGNLPFPRFNVTPAVTGTAGEVGARYKYTNVLTSPIAVDAIIELTEKVNATLVMVDDNSVTADRFQPRIKPSPNLGNSNQEGWIEWKISFVIGGTNTPTNIAQLFMTLYDIDGHDNGNTTFRETGWVTGNASGNVNVPTELTVQSGVSSSSLTWTKIRGSFTEHTDVSSDPEVAALSTYVNTSTVRFRQGYQYTRTSGQPEETPDYRQYAAEFKCFVFPTPGPLPLLFGNFNVAAKDKKATLTWSTYNEINVEKFVIERSVDGVNFEAVGVALPDGGRGTTANYMFPDNLQAISSNLVYYRVTAYDFDGKQKTTNIVSVRLDGKSNGGITISPVPAGSNAIVGVSVRQSGIADIRIVDMNGRTLLTQRQSVIAGYNNISLNNLSSLANGNYIVRLVINAEVYNEKLIIAR